MRLREAPAVTLKDLLPADARALCVDRLVPVGHQPVERGDSLPLDHSLVASFPLSFVIAIPVSAVFDDGEIVR
jgi:hypothetical protein